MAAITKQYKISAGNQDGHWYSTSTFSNTATTFTLTGSYYEFLMFQNVDIPKNCRIVNAVVKVCSSGSYYSDLTDYYLYGYYNSNAPIPTNYTTASDAPFTSSRIKWDVNIAWNDKMYYSTCDIKDIVKEIIYTTEWASNNSIGIVLTRSGGNYGINTRKIYNYEGGSAYAAILEITLEEALSTIETFSINAAGDDVYVRSTFDTVNDNVYVLQPTAQMAIGNYRINTSVHQYNEPFLRFTNFNVPKSAVIDAAYIVFTPSVAKTNPLRVNIYGNAVDSAVSPTTYNESTYIDNNLTVAFSDYYIYNKWYMDVPASSFDISEILAEIMSRAGWITGNPIQFIVQCSTTTTYQREFYDYSQDPLKAAKLIVIYHSSTVQIGTFPLMGKNGIINIPLYEPSTMTNQAYRAYTANGKLGCFDVQDITGNELIRVMGKTKIRGIKR